MRSGVRIGVDVGSVRIGVARSDPSGLVATPVTTLGRGPGDVDLLADLLLEHEAIEVVVGLPRTLSGGQGKAAADARQFAELIAARVSPIPVRMVDERLSTVAAHRALESSGLDSRQRRNVVDQAAAVIILQTALDQERATGAPGGSLVTNSRATG